MWTIPILKCLLGVSCHNSPEDLLESFRQLIQDIGPEEAKLFHQQLGTLMDHLLKYGSTCDKNIKYDVFVESKGDNQTNDDESINTASNEQDTDDIKQMKHLRSLAKAVVDQDYETQLNQCLK
jgi:hypothetical protein